MTADQETRIALERAVEADPNHAEARARLVELLLRLGQWEEAEGHLRVLVRSHPESGDVWINLGHALRMTGRVEEAADACREAVRLAPNHPAAHLNLATTLVESGQAPAAIESYRSAIRLDRNLAAAHSGLLYALHLDPEHGPQEIFQEHLNWAAGHEAPLASQIRPHENDRDPNRRLRIGYVSADFCAHPVGRFALPIIVQHDRDRFEVHLFSSGRVEDELTAEFRARADRWHDAMRLSDAELAAAIRQERIDVLVDLNGHVGIGRLLAFARKPAPVQVTYLGYPDTTGMAAMDYRITDAQADPAGTSERFYTERLVRLPKGFLCYRPPADPPPVSEQSPCEAKGFVTFGSFNNVAKLSADVIALWARLLREVKGSRLLIKARSLSEERTRDRLRLAFAEHEIEAERLEVRSPPKSYRQHLAAYADVDVALDTFPYNGTTTTCEALAMGVPVVTLAGKTHVSRVGASLLAHAGFKGWIAANPDEYVRIASDLASDVAKLRRQIRPTLLNSPLCDAARFTRDLEEAYVAMWHGFVSRP